MQYFVLCDTRCRWWYPRATTRWAAIVIVAWRVRTAIRHADEASMGIPEFARYVDPEGHPNLWELLGQRA
jgi:hypothetical protein